MSGGTGSTELYLYRDELLFQVCESFLLSHELFFCEEIKC